MAESELKIDRTAAVLSTRLQIAKSWVNSDLELLQTKIDRLTAAFKKNGKISMSETEEVARLGTRLSAWAMMVDGLSSTLDQVTR